MKKSLFVSILLLASGAQGAFQPRAASARPAAEQARSTTPPDEASRDAQSASQPAPSASPTADAPSAAAGSSTPPVETSRDPSASATASSTSATASSASTTASTASTTASTASTTSSSTSATADPPATAAAGSTWYVNGGGGTRYSVNNPTGQCNGTSAAAYPGSGVNQNCAFKDIRSLWTDGSYVTDPGAGAPGWGWVGASGDTYLIDCTGGALCRIGQSGPNSTDTNGGLVGNPYASGAPAPFNGTSSAHTRILGVNYASCSSAAAKAHVNGGYGVGSAFNLRGSSYVDVACFDVTDFSNCGRSGQANACNSSYPLSDYAENGIIINNTTTNTSITDVNIHGMAINGMLGATGDGVALTRVSLSGNPSSGWNMDDGSGTTGTGHLTLSYFTVQWSGCAEEYPIVDTQPYADCTDDNSYGYGDGVGTATVNSNPGWTISIDHSVAANNTQDGFDLLHLQGSGSSLTITDSLMYGNMGQQLKMGAAGTAMNNVIVGNCNALRQAIPGTPTGYNANLSDFCRASDVPVLMTVGDGATTRYINNTLYTANSIGVEVTGSCSTCSMQYENNIFLGFQNNAANGYPNGGSGKLPAPIYFDNSPVFGNAGSLFTNNLAYNFRDSWSCPQTAWGEQNALCADPGLVDETYHLYGYGNMSPAGASSIVVGKGAVITGITTDYSGDTRSTTAPTIGAYETTTTTTSQ